MTPGKNSDDLDYDAIFEFCFFGGSRAVSSPPPRSAAGILKGCKSAALGHLQVFYASVSPFFYSVPPDWACFPRLPPQTGAQPFLTDGTINNQYWGIKTDDSASAADNVGGAEQCPRLASGNGLSDIRLSPGTYYVDGQHTRVYSVSDKSIAVPSGISFDLNGSTLIQVPQ
jgi:hypothetical protein